jgi:hypothetical protein
MEALTGDVPPARRAFGPRRVFFFLSFFLFCDIALNCWAQMDEHGRDRRTAAGDVAKWTAGAVSSARLAANRIQPRSDIGLAGRR